jgi:hypothetical protein
MAKQKMMSIKTPCCGEMYWVKGLTTEEGALNELSGNMERSVTIRYHKDSQECKDLIARIDNFWEEARKEMGIKKAEPKTTIYKPVLDAEGNETDEVEFKFKTNATFKDGKTNLAKIYNAKGVDVTKEFIENNTQIGNGTTGVVFGSLAIYEYAKSFGVTSYLKGIQIKKLVEFDDGIKAEDISDGEGDDEEPAPI